MNLVEEVIEANTKIAHLEALVAKRDRTIYELQSRFREVQDDLFQLKMRLYNDIEEIEAVVNIRGQLT